MVVGYLHELDPMDLHAWFEAYVDDRWYTFDATQKQPRGNRITVAYGRDAADVAFTTQFGAMTLTDMKVWVSKAETDADDSAMNTAQHIGNKTPETATLASSNGSSN
jgi:transglutaminase-like putative cysteine protease